MPLRCAALRDVCHGAIVAGVSGGATLGLALAAAGVSMRAALLHEAVGSLYPGLLDQVRAAYQAGGVPAFASALYGPAWTADEAPGDPGAVARDLAMFSAFEPSAPLPGRPGRHHGRETLTAARHESVRRLADKFGLEAWELPGAGHTVHLEAPGVFAAAIRRLAAEAER